MWNVFRRAAADQAPPKAAVDDESSVTAGDATLRGKATQLPPAARAMNGYESLEQKGSGGFLDDELELRVAEATPRSSGPIWDRQGSGDGLGGTKPPPHPQFPCTNATGPGGPYVMSLLAGAPPPSALLGSSAVSKTGLSATSSTTSPMRARHPPQDFRFHSPDIRVGAPGSLYRAHDTRPRPAQLFRDGVAFVPLQTVTSADMSSTGDHAAAAGGGRWLPPTAGRAAPTVVTRLVTTAGPGDLPNAPPVPPPESQHVLPLSPPQQVNLTVFDPHRLCPVEPPASGPPYCHRSVTADAGLRRQRVVLSSTRNTPGDDNPETVCPNPPPPTSSSSAAAVSSHFASNLHNGLSPRPPLPLPAHRVSLSATAARNRKEDAQRSSDISALVPPSSALSTHPSSSGAGQNNRSPPSNSSLEGVDYDELFNLQRAQSLSHDVDPRVMPDPKRPNVPKQGGSTTVLPSPSSSSARHLVPFPPTGVSVVLASPRVYIPPPTNVVGTRPNAAHPGDRMYSLVSHTTPLRGSGAVISSMQRQRPQSTNTHLVTDSSQGGLRQPRRCIPQGSLLQPYYAGAAPAQKPVPITGPAMGGLIPPAGVPTDVAPPWNGFFLSTVLPTRQAIAVPGGRPIVPFEQQSAVAHPRLNPMASTFGYPKKTSVPVIFPSSCVSEPRPPPPPLPPYDSSCASGPTPVPPSPDGNTGPDGGQRVLTRSPTKRGHKRSDPPEAPKSASQKSPGTRKSQGQQRQRRSDVALLTSREDAKRTEVTRRGSERVSGTTKNRPSLILKKVHPRLRSSSPAAADAGTRRGGGRQQAVPRRFCSVDVESTSLSTVVVAHKDSLPTSDTGTAPVRGNLSPPESPSFLANATEKNPEGSSDSIPDPLVSPLASSEARRSRHGSELQHVVGPRIAIIGSEKKKSTPNSPSPASSGERSPPAKTQHQQQHVAQAITATTTQDKTTAVSEEEFHAILRHLQESVIPLPYPDTSYPRASLLQRRDKELRKIKLFGWQYASPEFQKIYPSLSRFTQQHQCEVQRSPYITLENGSPLVCQAQLLAQITCGLQSRDVFGYYFRLGVPAGESIDVRLARYADTRRIQNSCRRFLEGMLLNTTLLQTVLTTVPGTMLPGGGSSVARGGSADDSRDPERNTDAAAPGGRGSVGSSQAGAAEDVEGLIGRILLPEAAQDHMHMLAGLFSLMSRQALSSPARSDTEEEDDAENRPEPSTRGGSVVYGTKSERVLKEDESIPLQRLMEILTEMDLWPPETNAEDRHEIAVSFLISHPNFLSCLASGEPIPQVILQSAFTQALVCCPYNLPDFPAPSRSRLGDKDRKKPRVTDRDLLAAALEVCHVLLDVCRQPPCLARREAEVLAAALHDTENDPNPDTELSRRQPASERLHTLDTRAFCGVGLPPRWFSEQDLLLSNVLSIEELQTLLILRRTAARRTTGTESPSNEILFDPRVLLRCLNIIIGLTHEVADAGTWEFIRNPFSPETHVPDIDRMVSLCREIHATRVSQIEQAGGTSSQPPGIAPFLWAGITEHAKVVSKATTMPNSTADQADNEAADGINFSVNWKSFLDAGPSSPVIISVPSPNPDDDAAAPGRKDTSALSNSRHPLLWSPTIDGGVQSLWAATTARAEPIIVSAAGNDPSGYLPLDLVPLQACCTVFEILAMQSGCFEDLLQTTTE